MSLTISVFSHIGGAALGRESRIAVADAQYRADILVVVQLQIDRADDVVQARTKSSAGDDGCLGLCRFEEDCFPRAGFFEELPAAVRSSVSFERQANKRAAGNK